MKSRVRTPAVRWGDQAAQVRDRVPCDGGPHLAVLDPVEEQGRTVGVILAVERDVEPCLTAT